MSGPPSDGLPCKLLIDFANPEADASEFPNCLVRYEGAFMIVRDLTKTETVEHIFPAQTLDYVKKEYL